MAETGVSDRGIMEIIYSLSSYNNHHSFHSGKLNAKLDGTSSEALLMYCTFSEVYLYADWGQQGGSF